MENTKKHLRSSVNTRLLLIHIACIAALAAVIAPILLISGYNYPSADDWSHAAGTYKALSEGGGFFSVLKASFETVRYNYFHWEGRYANVFLASLQPGIWGEQYYSIVTWLMLGMLIFSELFLCRILLYAPCTEGAPNANAIRQRECHTYAGTSARHIAHRKSWLCIPVMIPPLLLQILYCPFPDESFYWYTGSVNYTFIYGLSLILLTLCITSGDAPIRRTVQRNMTVSDREIKFPPQKCCETSAPGGKLPPQKRNETSALGGKFPPQKCNEAPDTGGKFPPQKCNEAPGPGGKFPPQKCNEAPGPGGKLPPQKRSETSCPGGKFPPQKRNETSCPGGTLQTDADTSPRTITQGKKLCPKWKSALSCCLCCILAILVGGDNYATSLSCFLALLSLCVLFYFRNRKAFYKICLITLLEGAGLLICVLSPANQIRINANFAGKANSIPQAILMSLVRSFTNIYSWTNLKVVLMILFILPFVWKLVKDIAFFFRYPGLFTLFTFGLYSSQIAATMYIDGTTGGGRMAAILFYSYYLWVVGNVCYWTGWLVKRSGRVRNALENLCGRFGKYILYYCAVIGLLIVGIIYTSGLHETTTYKAYRNWRQGWAQQYAAEWEGRLEILHDGSVREVYFTPLSVYPEMLMYTDLQEEDGYIWVNDACALYYGKDSVRVIPPDRDGN